MTHDEFILLSGTACSHLSAQVAQLLGREPGCATEERFSDGEVNVHLDEPARGREVFLVQSTAPPVNDNLLKVPALAEACRRLSAQHLGAIRLFRSNESITDLYTQVIDGGGAALSAPSV